MHIYSVTHESTNPRFAKAFAAGCSAPVVEDAKYRGGAWAGFGSPVSWPSLNAARKAGATWYYGDHAYFDRFNHYRITRNAFQHTGVGERQRDPGVTIEPWRKDGSHVLICPPSENIAILMGFNTDIWCADVSMRLAANTDRPVRIRPRNATAPLVYDLADAWAMVTWTSNAAVEALVAGVPVFCTGDCAAAVMGRSDPVNIEYPIYPDNRYEWAATLAANQWTLDEMASGMAWSALNER